MLTESEKNELANRLIQSIKNSHISMNTTRIDDYVLFCIEKKYVDRFPEYITKQLQPYMKFVEAVDIYNFNVPIDDRKVCEAAGTFFSSSFQPPAPTNNSFNRDKEWADRRIGRKSTFDFPETKSHLMDNTDWRSYFNSFPSQEDFEKGSSKLKSALIRQGIQGDFEVTISRVSYNVSISFIDTATYQLNKPLINKIFCNFCPIENGWPIELVKEIFTNLRLKDINTFTRKLDTLIKAQQEMTELQPKPDVPSKSRDASSVHATSIISGSRHPEQNRPTSAATTASSSGIRVVESKPSVASQITLGVLTLEAEVQAPTKPDWRSCIIL